MGKSSSGVQQGQPSWSDGNGTDAIAPFPSLKDPAADPNSLQGLYQNVVGRNPDQPGYDFWKQKFGGTTVNEDQRKEFIGAVNAENLKNPDKWNPQLQTYKQEQNNPYFDPGYQQTPAGQSGSTPTNTLGGNYANTNFGPNPGSQRNNVDPTMGKGAGSMSGQGGSTNTATSGQPRMGQPNMYPNTIGMRDNSVNTTNGGSAKAKGA